MVLALSGTGHKKLASLGSVADQIRVKIHGVGQKRAHAGPLREKELQIVLKKIPNIQEELAEQVVTFIQKLRQKNLSKPPGVAETLDWATALISLGRTSLNEETVEQTLGCLVKSNEDLVRLRSEPSLMS